MVTLGPGLTKDRLVQACMRMRKLGEGQSVIFCGSLEVQRKILSCSGRTTGPIEVADVLKWCIATTCAHTRKSIPLWATQGMRHQRRRAIHAGPTTPVSVAESLLEDEAQSLEQRYGRQTSQNQMLPNASASSAEHDNDLHKIYAKCQEFNVVSFANATLQEEQERELSPETEREQQVELPPAAEPHYHAVHEDVWQLINQGILARSSDAFQPAFQSLNNTTANQFYESAAWPNDLIVTRDFARTVQATGDQLLDRFLRPVHWIVTYGIDATTAGCVILSPHEAQEILPSIRRYKKVVLHVYSPRCSVSVRSLQDLSFCAIPTAVSRTQNPPPSISLQLNLFAGQVYFLDFEEYSLFCSFLWLCSAPPDKHIQVASDGFIFPNSRANSESILTRACQFTKSPIPFIRSIVVMRRKGLGISVSHLGKILNGELIAKELF